MKNMFLWTVAACLATTLIVPAVYAGTDPKGKPFIALNGQIIEVKGEISSLQDQIDVLRGRVDSLEEAVAANSAAVLTLQDQNAALEALVYANVTTLEGIQTEIDYLMFQNQDLNSQIASTSGDVSDLEAQVAANNSMITSLEASILMVQGGLIDLGSSLQEQITANNKIIVAIQAEIELINANLAEKQALIDGSCPDGSAVQQINPDGSVVCGAAGGGVSGQFESQRVFIGQTAPSGGVVNFGTSCPEGYAATGAGVTNAMGWNINKLHTSPDDHPLYPNGALLIATNNNPFSSFITVVASCMRLVP